MPKLWLAVIVDERGRAEAHRECQGTDIYRSEPAGIAHGSLTSRLEHFEVVGGVAVRRGTCGRKSQIVPKQHSLERAREQQRGAWLV
jgi:hypothetical protein